VQPTDIRKPEYFHKVVDCQWACPAHTPVPEYIRLIAAGRYSDAYMVNWESNVFPGILGRTCDRPCEPACRRGRVEENNGDGSGKSKPEPVAICRLKRVAADHKDDIRGRLPQPGKPNGRRVACIGAGRLADGGARSRAAGLPHQRVRQRRQGRRLHAHPGAALPPARGGDRRGGRLHPRPRHRLPRRPAHRLAQGPAGRRFRCRVRRLRRAARARSRPAWPREAAAKHIHIGIDWLASVSFGHIDTIGKRVIVLGGGNTAMDCCRSARRLAARTSR